MRSRSLLKRASVALAMLTLAGAAHANVISNGDFEGLATGMGDLNSLNTPLLGVWNVEGTNQVVADGTPDAFGISAFGDQMLRVDQTGGGNAQTQQFVGGSFLAGSTVTFSVDLNGTGSNMTGGLFVNGYSSLAPGATIENLFNETFSLGNDGWETYTFSGVLSNDVSVLEAHIFFNNSGLSIAGGSYGFIDNASMTVTPPAVPAPPAVLLMVVGLLGLAAARQRAA